MTYRGTVKNGVVVFSKAPPLKEGTRVRVEPIARSKPKGRSQRKQPLRPVGRWAGGLEEIESLLTEVQRLRDADLSLERDAWQ